MNIKKTPAAFHRFDILWTPAVLLLDSSGKERYRVEGYLPRPEFAATLGSGLGRIAFMQKQWEQAERHYGDVVQRYGDTRMAAEATYWAGVAKYKRTNDHTVLAPMSKELNRRFPDSIWTKKASVWSG